MKLQDLLVEDLIAVPMEAGGLDEALHRLLDLAARAGKLDDEQGRALVEDLVSGEAGEVIRVNPDVVLVALQVPADAGIRDLSVLLGIASSPFDLPAELGVKGGARALFLLLTPRRTSTLKLQVIPTLTRLLRDETRSRRLLASSSVGDVRAVRELMEVELHESLKVEDALVPVKYRVYPDTSVSEILDLMIRRDVRAVPVVGERYEVLGIITTGDLLAHLLPRRRTGRDEEGGADHLAPLLARDVMTRTVMCVSEEQSLLEAANLLVNKNVDQVPVVREGELIGFLTRDTLLRSLFGRGIGEGTGSEETEG